jgi:hypothetical protein
MSPDAEATPVAGEVGSADHLVGDGPEVPPTKPPGRIARAFDLGLRVAGCVISVAAALLSGLLELFFASYRVGGYLIGVSVVFAVLVNAGIGWFAVRTVGHRWAVGPPWVVWTALMFLAAGVRTTEGDYLLAGDNWVGLIMILTGSLSFAIYAYRMILNGVPRR